MNKNEAIDFEELEKKFFGKIINPTSHSHVKGLCGDEMEFFLVIDDFIIKEIKFYTNGCGYTKACGLITSILANERNIDEVLFISPGNIIDSIESLPIDHFHCAILSINSLFRAISEYLLNNIRGNTNES